MSPKFDEAATVETIIVSSSRQPEAPPILFGEGRSAEVGFAEFSVAVPPDRTFGEIKLPDPKKPDPKTDFLVVSSRKLSGKNDFIHSINSSVARDPTGSREGVVFVHGYNTNFAEGLYRHAQLQNDMEGHGASVHFAWPSSASLSKYLTDRESALFSRDALAETITAMSRSSVRSFNLVAHSMGTFLLMETLRTMALEGNNAVFSKLSAVVLMSADIDVDVFLQQAGPLRDLNIPMYLVVSNDDKALLVSSKLRGEHYRLGAVTDPTVLEGLDVVILDISNVPREEMLGHFKLANSPALIEFFRNVHESGGTLFDQGRGNGMINASVSLVQGVRDVKIIPGSGW